MEGIIIRAAADDERPQVHRVIQRAWETTYTHIYKPDEIRQAFNGELPQFSSWAWRRSQRLQRHVAVHQGALIGAIGLSLLHDDRGGEVTSFYVDPPYQGQGVGLALWDYGLQILQEQGCKVVWVWVLEKAPARAFYERCGCVVREKGTYRIGKHPEVALGYWREL